MSQFVRTFGMLIPVGVPIREALEAAGHAANYGESVDVTADLRQAIRAGRPIARSLKTHNLLPPLIVPFVAWRKASEWGPGEEAGVLPDMLKKGADLLDKEADHLATSLLMKREPALTVVMGIIIGLILMGVYLRMCDDPASLK